VSSNGTANPAYTSYITANNGSWTLFEATVAPGTYVANIGIGGISINNTAQFKIDDYVVYDGSTADGDAPLAPTSPVISGVAAKQQTISWTAPGGGVDGGGYMVVRNTADPTTNPNAKGIYAVGNMISGSEQVVYLGTNPSFTDINLDPSTRYYYRIYAVDKAFNYSPSVAVDGTTTAPSYDTEPTAQVTGLNFTTPTTNNITSGFTINWTAAVSGGGTGHLVVVKASSDFTAHPVDGNTYNANTTFGTGAALGGGYVVYSGTGTSVVISGLTKLTTYYVRVYDYNGSAGTENYYISSPTSGTNLSAPGELVSNGTSPSSAPKSYSDGTAWVGGIAPGQNDNVTITANDFFNVGSTQKCYNLTINSGSKLSSGTAQTFQVYGTSMVCNGTFGDASIVLPANGGTGSALTLEFGNNLSLSGSGSIYPYKVRPVSSLSNIGITFASNTTITYNVAGTLSDNTGNDNISFTVNPGVTLSIAGNMNTLSSSASNGNANTTWNINGTVNVAGYFSPMVASAKSFICNINNGGTLSVLNLSPTQTGGATPTVNVDSGGKFIITGSCDLSGSIPVLFQGDGTFTTGPVTSVKIANNSGLDSSTGPIRTSSLNFDAGTSFTFQGSSAQDTGNNFPSSIGALTINNASGVTFSKSTTVNGTLTLTSGTLYVGANTLTLRGTRSGTGSIDGTSGTIVYSGTSSQTASTLVNVNNLTLNNTAVSLPGLALGAATTINGTLTLQAGSIFNGSPNPNITLADGSAIVCSGGGFSSGAPVFGNSVNLTYTGSATKGFEFPAADIISSLTVNNTSGIALTDNRNIPTLNIGSGSTLTVNAGKQLTVSTSLTNNGGTLNLLSTSADGTATLLTPGSLSGTGGIYSVNQWLNSGRNYYISSPVTGATSAVVKDKADSRLWKYTEPNTGTILWDEITLNNESLEVGRGYVAKLASDDVITFNGTLNNGSVTSPTLTAAGTVSTGFNLVGNPYPSFVNWTDVIKTNVSTSIWYRSKSTGSYLFQTYNVSGDGVGVNGGSNIIPPMQSFWVKVPSGTGTIGFTNSMRSHQDQSGSSNRLKAPGISTQKLLRLLVSNEINTDETVVYFNSNAQDGFDAYDSPKMTNSNIAIPEIYTTVGKEQLAINGLNNLAANMELALGFNTGTSNNFTIKASEVNNFDADTKIILKDNVLNTEWDLTGGSAYSFTSDAINTSSRFTVIFRTSAIATEIENFNYNDRIFYVFQNANNQITIQRNFNENATISVCNAVGQELVSTLMTGTCKVIDQSFSPGVYFVTVNAAGNKTTKKVIVN